jgi:hypothetical protein
VTSRWCRPRGPPAPAAPPQGGSATDPGAGRVLFRAQPRARRRAGAREAPRRAGSRAPHWTRSRGRPPSTPVDSTPPGGLTPALGRPGDPGHRPAPRPPDRARRVRSGGESRSGDSNPGPAAYKAARRSAAERDAQGDLTPGTSPATCPATSSYCRPGPWGPLLRPQGSRMSRRRAGGEPIQEPPSCCLEGGPARRVHRDRHLSCSHDRGTGPLAGGLLQEGRETGDAPRPQLRSTPSSRSPRTAAGRWPRGGSGEWSGAAGRSSCPPCPRTPRSAAARPPGTA